MIVPKIGYYHLRTAVALVKARLTGSRDNGVVPSMDTAAARPATELRFVPKVVKHVVEIIIDFGGGAAKK
jgi:hypothetical protein